MFRRFFSGTSPTNGNVTVIAPAGSMFAVVRTAGWIYESGVKEPVSVEWWMQNGSSNRCFVVVRADNRLEMRVDGAVYASQKYQISVDFIKSGYPL